MVGSLLSYLLALLLALAGSRGGLDLLDIVPTDVYWQLKGIQPQVEQLEKDARFDAPPASIERQLKDLAAEDFQVRDRARRELEGMGPAILEQLKPAVQSADAETAAVAAELVRRFNERSQERSIRRLMAIRTLGERKEARALPLLEGLIHSGELFVADYARRAQAQIKGEVYERGDLAAPMARDLAMVPADAALVAQSTGLNPVKLSLVRIIEMAAQAGADDLAVTPEQLKARKNEMLRQASASIVEVVERLGNVRLDGVTLGFTLDDNDQGWAVVAFRGEYHAQLMYRAFRETMGADAKALPWGEPGVMPEITAEEEEMRLLFAGNDLLVFLAGPDGAQTRPLRDKIVTAIRTGQGHLGENAALAALMQQVDRQSPAWAAGRIPAPMKSADLAAFDTFTMESRMVREGVDMTIRATGEDAGKIRESVEQLNAGIQETVKDFQAMAADTPAMQALVDLVSSIKFTSEGKEGRMTMHLRPDLLESLLSIAGSSLLESLLPQRGKAGMGEVIEVRPVEPLPGEVPPVGPDR